jgi:hypothetical protein
LIVAGIGVAALCAFTYAAAGARELGRSDPKTAANYRLPWFNFSETYTDGVALGVSVGSTNVEAVKAAERAGLIVQPSGWGDNRAGGADLYQRPALVDAMVRQPYLNFSDPMGKRGMTVDFRDGRVVAIRVHYINFEAI